MQASPSDIVIYYIDVTFLDITKANIYNSFSLLESFGDHYYDDDLTDLLMDENSFSSEEKQDRFMGIVTSKITTVITEHGINLNKHIVTTLEELNEITRFLFIIQILDDYEYLSYRLFANDDDISIITDLISYLTLIDKFRLLDIIETIDDKLLTALRAFVTDKSKDTEYLEHNHENLLNIFTEFTKDNNSLGKLYRADGFKNITIKELHDILPYRLSIELDKLIEANPANGALNIMSILLLCKDTYELPLLMFKKNTELLIDKSTNIIKIENILTNMLVDFTVFKDEYIKNFHAPVDLILDEDKD